MVFDLTAVASRLEALQHSSGEDGPKGGEGRRGFLAQIRPDSNAAAEEELRREIRWAVRTMHMYTRLHAFLYCTLAARRCLQRWRLLARYVSCTSRGMLVAIAMSD